MATHLDDDHRRKILDELKVRADLMTELGKNSHQTANVIRKWKHNHIEVSEKEPDPQGVLRISIGGRPDIRNSEYCSFRGDQSKCIDLLERALKSLKAK